MTVTVMDTQKTSWSIGAAPRTVVAAVFITGLSRANSALSMAS